MSLQALQIYAGPVALAHIEKNGLQAQHIGAIAAAAGGPKGLILGALDRFIFGQWLPQSEQKVDLIGASIGAWRMASACMPDPVLAFERLEQDYIAQRYDLEPGQSRLSPQMVSALFAQTIEAFLMPHAVSITQHPRYRLHLLVSKGRSVLKKEQDWLTPMGFFAAFLSNLISRKALGHWLERYVFSSSFTHQSGHEFLSAIPFDTQDYPTHLFSLTADNLLQVVQASCSIPMVLEAVKQIKGCEMGAYWDGGLTDYHLHLDYRKMTTKAELKNDTSASLVLYPHFQQALVPGWLDKSLKWRHQSSPFIDNVVVLAPQPQWIQSLPNQKLPDRQDFVTYAKDYEGRVNAWQTACKASEQLSLEWQSWLKNPDFSKIKLL
jgi:hypothetical protein